MRVYGRRTVLVAAATGLLAGCDRPEALGGDPASGTVVLTTGSTKGVYYGWGRELATQVNRVHPRLRVRVEPSSGSLHNIARLRADTHHVAIATEDAVSAADTEILVALARVYDDYVHVAVRDDSPFRTLIDLTGRPVSTGQPGSGVALVSRRVLEAANVKVEEKATDVVVGTDALGRGFVDAVFWSGGLPTRAFSELASRTRIRLLPLDRVAPAMRRDYKGVYRPATVPPGIYGITEPVPTIATANLMLARADLPGTTVEALLDALFRRRDAIGAVVPAANALDRRTAISTGFVPLHPAATAYYRQVKP